MSPFDDDAGSPPRSPVSPVIPDRTSQTFTGAPSAGRAPSMDSAAPSIQSDSFRSFSTSSRFSMPRAMSPYTGQTGPSQPYGMYQQGIGVGRSLSSSTVSTVRPSERNFTGAVPPQHPYALYSQTTVPEEAVGETQDSSIPIGFPTQQRSHQSPANQTPNEVGDIVGPDGHTEQLPPYSRYPDGLPPKEDVSPPPVEELSNTVSPVEAQTNVPPESEVSSRTLLAENAGRNSQEPNSTPDDPSGGFKEKLAQKSKRKVCCGLPVWVFLLLAAVLIIGAAIGGVIGGLLGSQQGAKKSNKPTVTVTSAPTPTAVWDAVPLSSTPSDLLPLPTGSFDIPAKTLNESSNGCITNRTLHDTWQCKSSGMFSCVIQQNTDTSPKIKFKNKDLDGTFVYGAQDPVFQNEYYPLELMQDKTAMDRGPAYYFFAPVDKLIIIPEEDFPSEFITPGKFLEERQLWRRRSISSKKVTARPGDEPWFCWWNSTLIETFIYVNETTSEDSDSETEAETPSPSVSTTFTTQTSHKPRPAMRRREAHTLLNFYPRSIKIQEKRSEQHGAEPYCEQMRVMDDATLTRPLDQDSVTIREQSPWKGPSMSGPFPELGKRGGDHSDPNCYCRWQHD